jgi:hypothetical protein
MTRRHLPNVPRPIGGLLSVALVLAFLNGQASAQTPVPSPSREAPAPPSSQEMAKQLSNPVASLVSVPLQFNWDSGVGPNEDLRYVMNFQPVVPFTLNEDWNLIGRFILPFIGQPALGQTGQASSGTGDIVMSAFFSPAKGNRMVWGVGPVFGLPTTSDPTLGSGKWSIGPTAVVLKQTGHVTVGALMNHLWSIAGTSKTERADVSQTLLQPFFAYTTSSAITLSVNLEASANWETEGDRQWSVPVNVSVSKVTRVGPFPFSVGAGVGVFAATPEGGPDWKLRMTMTLILPRSR